MTEKIYEDDDWMLGRVKIKIKGNGDIWLYVNKRDISWYADGLLMGKGIQVADPPEDISRACTITRLNL